MFAFDRVVDHQVRLEVDLRDPTWKGGCIRSANSIYPWEAAGDQGWRYGNNPVQLSQRLQKRSPSL
jgi:hypothetical protein